MRWPRIWARCVVAICAAVSASRAGRCAVWMAISARRRAGAGSMRARRRSRHGPSARWANAIIAANDDQYRLARDAQYRHIVGLRAAIATIEKRLAAPTTDTLTVSERKARRKTRR